MSNYSHLNVERGKPGHKTHIDFYGYVNTVKRLMGYSELLVRVCMEYIRNLSEEYNDEVKAELIETMSKLREIKLAHKKKI